MKTLILLLICNYSVAASSTSVAGLSASGNKFQRLSNKTSSKAVISERYIPIGFLTAAIIVAGYHARASFQTPTKRFLGVELPVVDIHLHYGTPESSARIINAVIDSIPLARIWLFKFLLKRIFLSALSSTFHVKELRGAGITEACVMAIYAERTMGYCTNEMALDHLQTVQQMQQKIKLHVMVSADFDATSFSDEINSIRSYLKLDEVVGIKIAHYHSLVPLDDPRSELLYKLSADMQKPIHLHTGDCSLQSLGHRRDPPYTDVSYLEKSIEKHPKTVFVLGNMGYSFKEKGLGQLEVVLALARKYSNVYLVPSSLGSKRADPTGANLRTVMRRLKEEGLIGRTIYGSDGPQGPGHLKDYLRRTLLAMEAASYSEEEMRDVLSRNFYRVYRPKK